jgi:acyl-CoA thioester hydrolase
VKDEPKKGVAREKYRRFFQITTRWADNDAYGHINNVTYYSFFDTVVNQFLIESDLLSIDESGVIGLVVQSSCAYFAPLRYPEQIEGAMAVSHVGRSSVRYEIGIFGRDQSRSAASGYLVHVYVDRVSRLPLQIPAALRVAVGQILVEP